MMMILIIVIIALLFLLLRRNNTARRPYDYSRPEPPYQGGYDSGFGGGMGRGVGMFAGGLAAGALLTYLWEKGRLNEEQFNYFNSLGNDEAIRQLQEQNLIQQEEIDNLRSQLGEEDSEIQEDDHDWEQDNNYDDGTDGSYDDGGDDWI